MQQQYQILRSLNQCYAQLQQQHQDMAVLQQQFQELFSYNPSSSAKQNDGSPNRPQTASPNITSHASPLFMNLPSSSLAQPPFSAPLVTQPPVTFAFQPPSSAPVLRTGAWYPSQEVSSANENTQTSDSPAGRTQNARTGIPSPRAAVRSGHPVEPASPPNPSSLANSVKVVREVGTSTPGMGLSPGNFRTGRKYDPSSYQGECNKLFFRNDGRHSILFVVENVTMDAKTLVRCALVEMFGSGLIWGCLKIERSWSE